MYYTKETTVFLNGEWLRAEEANLSLYNQSLHYGLGAFEGIRSYKTENGAKVFKAREHYERLIYSAKSLQIDFKYSCDELIDLTYQLLEKNKLSDAYIRPLVYLGQNMGLHPSQEVNLFIAAWNWGKLFEEKMLDVVVSSYERPNPKASPVDAKLSGHYINSALATQDAKVRGYDEALLQDMNGNIAEGPGANFFFEKDGKLYTCPTDYILPGITRATILELAEEMGIEVVQEYFRTHEVENQDGAFFVGTAAEVAPIGSLNGKKFKKNWKDTLGYQLSKRYKDLVLERNKQLVNA